MLGLPCKQIRSNSLARIDLLESNDLLGCLKELEYYEVSEEVLN